MLTVDEAYHYMHITSCGDGRARVVHQTNDDDDDGIPDFEDPGQLVAWVEVYPSVQAALERCGVCRIGVSGVKVIVTLDGEQVCDED